MRTILYAMMMSLALHGCGTRSAPDETGSAPSPGTASAGGCYQRVEGRDTTFLRLDEDGPAVTGELVVMPFEKDKARGAISGTLSGSQVRADWQRSGEGVTEPYEVVFTLRGDTVTWWEGERVRREGKWVLKEPGAGYRYVMVRSDCL
jgi:hypothetical protein